MHHQAVHLFLAQVQAVQAVQDHQVAQAAQVLVLVRQVLDHLAVQAAQNHRQAVRAAVQVHYHHQHHYQV